MKVSKVSHHEDTLTISFNQEVVVMKCPYCHRLCFGCGKTHDNFWDDLLWRDECRWCKKQFWRDCNGMVGKSVYDWDIE